MTEYLSTPFHYVYYHVDPETLDIAYIGSGQKERAWISRKNNRHPEHFEWLQSLENKGFIPSDWVVILDRFPTKEAAKLEEQTLIAQYKPKYNRMGVAPHLWCMTFTTDEIEMIKALRSDGMSYSKIAEEVGRSVTGVWRVCNDKSKGYLHDK